MSFEIAPQVASITCEPEGVVAPRQRQRKRGATPKKKDPAALAAGNGHKAVIVAAAESEAVKPPAKWNRRRFQRLALGPAVYATEGRVERWQEEILVFADEDGREKVWVPVEEAGRHEVVLNRYTRRPTHRRVRILDAEGFPTTGLTGWTETDRWLSEPAVIKFREGQTLPRFICRASSRERRRHPGQVVGGLRLVYTEPPKESQPRLRWFPASNQEQLKAFLASLPEAPEEIKAALAAEPEPVETPEQWFRVTLPQVCLDHGAWEEYPEGWCAKLAPRPGGPTDPDWMYVQLPFHFFVWYEDETGRLSSRRKSDLAKGGGKVECGMWIPHWLIEPISVVQAAKIYDLLEAQVMADDRHRR